MQPVGVPAKSISDVWADNPSAPAPVWLPGVYVTAVSKGQCVAGEACQLFVQDAETYASLQEGAKHGVRVFASAASSSSFAGIVPGDRVDLLGFASRVTQGGQNELLVTASQATPGCAKKVGVGAPSPITVTLDVLTTTAFETTTGPLLVKVQGVSGKPNGPNQLFGLWQTGVFNEAGVDTITSLSPFFLPAGQFAGLVQDKIHNFTAVTGVFAVYFEPNSALKFEVLYPRVQSEVEVLFVQP